ncbi:YfhJ family protein [Terribacillus saccharophilus]|uniref:YfhJ family protein n=1 Tax=Terribacillus saccharophilus TaxID=361277 RepID=UPI003982299B
MENKFRELAALLQEQNDRLTIDEARTWVEILWEDFEATRAKAGRKYQGQEMTEAIVRQWIQHYGPRLDEFLDSNPKYHHLFMERRQQ